MIDSTAEELLGAIAARLKKQAALRQWFAAQSQSVSESPMIATSSPEDLSVPPPLE